MRTFPAAALPAAACLWLLLIVAAPVAASRGAVPLGTLATYGAGSLLCHQQAERSFAIAGLQMPVCGRCFGLYLAGAAGALGALVFGRRRPGLRVAVARVALAMAAVPMLLSVGLEWGGLVAGSNASRFASALPLGLTGGWLLQRTITAAAPGDRLDALSFRGA